MTGAAVAFAYDRPTSAKVACSVCGRRGYRGGTWQDVCRRGHKPCRWCGRPLVVLLDGSARLHARCPKHPHRQEIP